MEQLPYVFDLFYDLKTEEELCKRLMKLDVEISGLLDLVDRYDMREKIEKMVGVLKVSVEKSGQ